MPLDSNVLVNINNHKQASLCIKCSGMGEIRSNVKLIISIVILLILIPIEVEIFAVGGIVSDGKAIFVLTLMALGFDFYIAYWGFKKQICPVCHGSGKVNL